MPGSLNDAASDSPLFFGVMDKLAQAHVDQVSILHREINELRKELAACRAFAGPSSTDCEFQTPSEFPPFTPRPRTNFTPRKPLSTPRRLLTLPTHYEQQGTNLKRASQSASFNPALAKRESAPWEFGTNTHETAVRQAADWDLHAGIGNLAKQQECLNERISEVLSFNKEAMSRMSNAGTISSTVSKKYSVGSVGKSVEVHRVSSGSLASRGMDSSSTMRSRFAVKSGSTKEHLRVSAWNNKFESINLKALHNLVNSPVFSVFSSLLILSYAIFIAMETEMLAQDPGVESRSVRHMHYVYNAIFSLELFVRLFAEGCHAAFFGKDAIWNRLDAVLVLSAFIEVVVEAIAAGALETSGSVVRAVRIARVVRTVRLVRTFRHFHEFQKMAYALVSSFSTLVCSLLLLIFVMFFFAVGLTQLAADAEMRIQIQDLDLRYGDLMSTMYTLFLSVSNGISWDLSYMPLYHLGWRSAAAFIIYIIVALFGVLNVVTSIFVESVFRSAQHYKDLIIQDKETAKQLAMVHVRELFRQLDFDESGKITRDELENLLKEGSLRKYMEALDIDTEDTCLLFNLLDVDGSKCISLEEFCEGCLRIKGNARSIDVQALIFQLRNFLDKWGEFTFFVEDSFSDIRQKM